MNKEYLARLWYEENRKHTSPRIYFLTQIPTPLISKDKVEYRNLNGFQYVVTLHEIIGSPRYSQWGADVQNCSVKYTRYYLDHVVLCTPKGIYKLHYYYESGTQTESQEVAKNILWKRLFGIRK